MWARLILTPQSSWAQTSILLTRQPGRQVDELAVLTTVPRPAELLAYRGHAFPFGESKGSCHRPRSHASRRLTGPLGRPDHSCPPKTTALLAKNRSWGEGWSPCIFYRMGLLQLLESDSNLYRLPKALTLPLGNFCMPFLFRSRWNKRLTTLANPSSFPFLCLHVFIRLCFCLSYLVLSLCLISEKRGLGRKV